jgi:hypothetical protein
MEVFIGGEMIESMQSGTTAQLIDYLLAAKEAAVVGVVGRGTGAHSVGKMERTTSQSFKTPHLLAPRPQQRSPLVRGTMSNTIVVSYIATWHWLTNVIPMKIQYPFHF